MKSFIFLIINFLAAKLLLGLVYFYRFCLKPFMGGFASCRFEPTCSQYAIDALKNYPAYKAVILIFKRLSKCHPFGSYGYDPLPCKHGDKTS